MAYTCVTCGSEVIAEHDVLNAYKNGLLQTENLRLKEMLERMTEASIDLLDDERWQNRKILRDALAEYRKWKETK